MHFNIWQVLGKFIYKIWKKLLFFSKKIKKFLFKFWNNYLKEKMDNVMPPLSKMIFLKKLFKLFER